MRPLILAIALLTLAPVATAAEDLKALLSGNEVRRAEKYGGGDLRYDRWLFARDGTFSGTYVIEFGAGTDTSYEEDGSVFGSWRIAGDRLCITDKSPRGSGEVCFVLTRSGANDLSIVFTGAEVGSDHEWRFEVPRKGK